MPGRDADDINGAFSKTLLHRKSWKNGLVAGAKHNKVLNPTRFLSRLWLTEARHMRCFSDVVGGVNFCRVFAFSSVLWQRADRRDATFRGILVFNLSSANLSKDLLVQEVNIILWPLNQDSHRMTVSYSSPKATGPIVTKFQLEFPRAEGTKIVQTVQVTWLTLLRCP